MSEAFPVYNAIIFSQVPQQDVHTNVTDIITGTNLTVLFCATVDCRKFHADLIIITANSRRFSLEYVS